MNLVFHLTSGGYWEEGIVRTKYFVQTTISTQSSTLNLNMEALSEDVSMECLPMLGPSPPPRILPARLSSCHSPI